MHADFLYTVCILHIIGGADLNARQTSALAKVFAISGAALLCGSVLFTLASALVGSIQNGALLFDTLMLVQLFPLVALGLAMLVLASLLTRIFRKWFGWGAVAALAALACAQIFLRAYDLTAAAAAINEAVFAVVIASVAVYGVVIAALGVLGVFLVRRLFQRQANTQPQKE